MIDVRIAPAAAAGDTALVSQLAALVNSVRRRRGRTLGGRYGYRPVRTGQIEESYPELAPLLATPCDFVIYHKSINHA
jgi:hypothetical protein